MAYRADIDGLRAIAVTAVVLFHAGIAPFRSGYVGVDVFFVISGYLIGGIILRDMKAERFRFSLFYARRARRILPALLTTILVTCIFGWLLLSPFQFRSLGTTSTYALLGLSNVSYYELKDYFAPVSQLYPLLMTWSLGVEEQFYLVFPCLMLAVMRWVPRKAMIVLVGATSLSFLFSTWETYSNPAAAFYLLPSRAWELGVGVILAFVELNSSTRHASGSLESPGIHRELIGAGGLVLLGCSTVAFNATTPFPGFAATLPVLGTALLLRGERSLVNRYLLSSRPLVFIGMVSYSWYLWHWPLMSYIRNVAFDEPPARVMLMAVVASFGLAILSWRLVEQPFRHGPIRVRPVLIGYSAALSMAILLCLTIRLEQGFPGHVSAGARRVDAALAAGIGGACLVSSENGDKPNLSSPCVSEKPGRPTVVLIGDSHASALGEGVRTLAAEQDWGYEIFAKAACRPLVGVTNWNPVLPKEAAACATFMKSAFKRASSNPQVRTVILAGFWPKLGVDTDFRAVPPYPEVSSKLDLFHDGLRRAVTSLTAAGKRVIVLGDVPTFRFNVGQIALTKSRTLRSIVAPWLWSRAPDDFPNVPGLEFVYTPSDENTRFFQSLTEYAAVDYNDLFSRFCSGTSCIIEQNGQMLFLDSHHVSAFGSRYALQGLDLDYAQNSKASIADK